MKTIRVGVRLREVEPVVRRVLDVPATVTLPELHQLLQAGLGWTDSHLHQFETEGALYGMANIDPPEDEHDEAGVRLRDLPARFVYSYDFGDGWEHDVDVLGPGEQRPGCVYGEGTCPPEDCGGPGGYAGLLAVLADPGRDGHADARARAGDLSDFDQSDTDLLVRQVAGEVPDSVRLVLDLAAEGVRLTPGGRLPRWFVRAVQEQRPRWHPLRRPAATEEDLLPLAALHGVLRDVGLLRLRHQVLTPIRAAGDETEVVRRLRSWFAPDHGFISALAGVAVADLASSGPWSVADLTDRIRPWLGDGWVTSDGSRLTEQRLRMELCRLADVLTGLDLIDADSDAWAAGPSARWLLPGATNLAALWSPTASGRTR